MKDKLKSKTFFHNQTSQTMHTKSNETESPRTGHIENIFLKGEKQLWLPDGIDLTSVEAITVPESLTLTFLYCCLYIRSCLYPPNVQAFYPGLIPQLSKVCPGQRISSFC